MPEPRRQVRRYDPAIRPKAVAAFYQLVAAGRSQAAARREAGAQFDVNPSSLRTWIESGQYRAPDAGRNPGGKATSRASRTARAADADTPATLAAARRRIARLETEVARLQGKLAQARADAKTAGARRTRPRTRPAAATATGPTASGAVPAKPDATASATRHAQGNTTASATDREATAQLRALWERNYANYGLDKLWRAARREGHDWGKARVRRLMRAAGIEGRRMEPRRYWIALLRRGPSWGGNPATWPTPTAPNQWWGLDTTVVPLGGPGRGETFVVLVTDVFSRLIIGWHAGTLTFETLRRLVQEATAQRLGGTGGTGADQADQAGAAARGPAVRGTAAEATAQGRRGARPAKPWDKAAGPIPPTITLLTDIPEAARIGLAGVA
ncbi:MAG: IS3 family transposase, partial [Bifidobacteriaceae bacterium]|nr:IS3 family transposase [Bifidobacteriaceae bacterium]